MNHTGSQLVGVWEEWFYQKVAIVCRFLGITLVITCNFCSQEIEADNIFNHVKWHVDRGDEKWQKKQRRQK